MKTQNVKEVFQHFNTIICKQRVTIKEQKLYSSIFSNLLKKIIFLRPKMSGTMSVKAFDIIETLTHLTDALILPANYCCTLVHVQKGILETFWDN